jgi:2-dehydro-3-deoxygalactonokinase
MARIIVDWGTSSFRAYRFGGDGGIAQVHQARTGIMTVEGGAFEDALFREIGPWLAADSDVFLSGMITSRNGWLETPYVETPATLGALAAGARSLEARNGAALRFLPGVCQREPSPDVMRGEEIQVFGCVRPGDDATVVLPGTHSKWVTVRDGVITGFRSFMTGELFAVMQQHSILGRLIPENAPADRTAFLAGVRQALRPGSAGLLNDLFTARSGALLERFPATEIAERLSGLIIGHEIAGGLALGWTGGDIKVVGDPALVERYLAALRAAGLSASAGPANAAVEGFRRLGATIQIRA